MNNEQMTQDLTKIIQDINETLALQLMAAYRMGYANKEKELKK